MIIIIIVGTGGKGPKKLDKRLEERKIRRKIKTIQTDQQEYF